MEKEPKEVQNQIFVRNLNYQTTDQELTDFFQEFGPIKQCMIIRENGASRGFGFVKFALEEDARAALESKQSFKFQGRELKLYTAVKENKRKRGHDDMQEPIEGDVVIKTETSKPLPATSGANAKKSKLVTDTSKPLPTTSGANAKKAKLETPNSSKQESQMVKKESKLDAQVKQEKQKENSTTIKRTRQLIVFGIPVDITKRAFQLSLPKIVRKGVQVELITEDHELSKSLLIVNPPGKLILITAASKKDIETIAEAINNASVETLNIRSHMKKSEKAVNEDGSMKKKLKEKLTARIMTHLTHPDHRKRKCRVIIRNLSFEATEQNVVDKMGRFGPIVSVEIPRSVEEKKVLNRRKGKDGETAGPVQKLRPRGFGFVTYLCECDATTAVKESAAQALKICNREVAVDLCLNKETFLKYGLTAEDGKEGGDEGDKSLTDVEDDEEADDEDGDLAGDQEDDEEDVDDAEHGVVDMDDDEEDGDVPDNTNGVTTKASNSNSVNPTTAEVKRNENDVNEGLTVFIRGLPFDAESADIRQALKDFGRLQTAVVVKDHDTGISKGSAFVKFADKQAVAACLAAAVESGGGLVVKGRICKVDLAVDRAQAAQLKLEEKVGKDKRNLYLANEGLLTEPGSGNNSNSGMLEAEKVKRQRAQAEKRKKLQNPLFFVSPYRLSIRNLAKSITNNEMKIACLKALKAGLTAGLVTPTDMQSYITAQGKNAILPAGGVDSVTPFDPKTIKTAKVMLDNTRMRGGVAQSRGFGFVEFSNHSHALACLRELNNLKKASYLPTEKGRLIVEFSVENIQKVKILEQRNSKIERKRAASRQADGDGENGSVNEDDEKKKKKRAQSKRARILEKKKLNAAGGIVKDASEAKNVDKIESIVVPQQSKKRKLSPEKVEKAEAKKVKLESTSSKNNRAQRNSKMSTDKKAKPRT